LPKMYKSIIVVAGATLTLLILSLFWPSPLFGARVLCVTCTQRLDHALVMNGTPIPITARCVGIYAGAMLTFLAITLSDRRRGYLLPPRRVLAIMAFLFLVMGFDGINATTTDIAGIGLYQETNVHRLFAGIGFGVAMALLCYPLMIGAILGNRGEPLAPVHGFAELARLLAMAYGLGILMAFEPAWMLYPTAFLTLTGQLSTYVLLNGMIIATLNRRIPHTSLLLLSLLLALLEIRAIGLIAVSY
jgi:uncharacterized membrane protein